MNRQKQRIALWLLVLFALGGILAPLAHDGLHALDAHDPHHDSTSDQVVEFHAEDVKCELCEITLAAADITEDASAGKVYLDAPVLRTNPVLLAKASVFQSRAPPAIQ